MPPDGASRRRLAWIAGGWVALQLAYLLAIPASSGPDEPEHLAYVHAISRDGRLPVLRSLPEPVRDDRGRVVEFRDRPTGLAGPYTFQAQHPPLVYLAYAAWDRLLSGRSTATSIRLLGLVWGLIAVVALAALARDLPAAERWPATRWALPAMVLLPAPAYLCAVVGNDGPGLAVGAVMTWRLVRLLHLPPTRREAAWVAGSLAVGLLCKLTFVVFLPGAVWLWWRAERRAGRSAAKALLAAVGVALLGLLPALGWAAYCWSLYGTPVPRAHARPTLYGLHQVAEPDAVLFLTVQSAYVLIQGLASTVAPLWLVFRLSWSISSSLILAMSIAGLLAGVGLVRLQRRPTADSDRPLVALLLGPFILMTGLLLQQFLFQDYLVGFHGGRYFLPTLPGLVLAFALGCEAQARESARRRLAIGLVLGFVLFSLLMLPVAATAVIHGAFG